MYSQSRKTARKQLLLQHRKAQIRKLSQEEEQPKPTIPKYRKDSLKGLVIQVPENGELHVPAFNPYSPRSQTYYIS